MVGNMESLEDLF